MENRSMQDGAEALLTDLCERFPLGYRPALVWKNLRVTAGIAYYRTGAIALSSLVLTDETQLTETLIHEYAHLMAVVRHGARAAGHGQAWRDAMQQLGRRPEVRHQYGVQRNERRQEVGYRCVRCGATIVRHRKFARGHRYVHVACGGALKLSFVHSVTTDESEA